MGKSTLFNRLIGKRQSIEYLEENTTRDVIRGLVWYDKRAIEIIDTAGDTKKVEELITKKAQGKREDLLGEASHILFITDEKSDLNAEDQRILRAIRKTGKPFSVVVTKIDNKQTKKVVLSLGVDTHAVSAIHNLGVLELKDYLESYAKKLTLDIKGDVVILGRPNAGKSTLFNRLVGEAVSIVSNIPGTTRDVVTYLVPFSKKKSDVLMRVHDTAGLTKRSKAMAGVNRYATHRINEALKIGDCALLCIDGSDRPATQDAHVAEMAIKAGLSVIIVITKWDNDERRKIADQEEWLAALQKRFRFAAWIPAIFVSAESGENIKELKQIIEQSLSDREQFWGEKELATFLEGLNKIDQRLRIITSFKQVRTGPPEMEFQVRGVIHESLVRQVINRMRDVYPVGITPIQWRLERPQPKRPRGRR